jgi:uncharacterized protein (TIGR04255 family)
MADDPKFEPIFPSHAIERCGITVTFREVLPEKSFDKAGALASEASARKGFRRLASNNLGISIDAMTGKLGPIVGAQPQTFVLPDQSASLFLAPSLIIWQNARYVRWEPFIGHFQDVASATLGEFFKSVSLASVRLEYWDRFNWTGSWNDFDALQLIRPDATAVVNQWQNWRRQWHSHAGWFEHVESCRRLVNVNIDVGEVADRPSVLIYTMMLDEPNVAGYGEVDVKALDEKYVFARLEVLHKDLKSLLGSVLQQAMIHRIGLISETRT